MKIVGLDCSYFPIFFGSNDFVSDFTVDNVLLNVDSLLLLTIFTCGSFFLLGEWLWSFVLLELIESYQNFLYYNSYNNFKWIITKYKIEGRLNFEKVTQEN